MYHSMHCRGGADVTGRNPQSIEADAQGLRAVGRCAGSRAAVDGIEVSMSGGPGHDRERRAGGRLVAGERPVPPGWISPLLSTVPVMTPEPSSRPPAMRTAHRAAPGVQSGRFTNLGVRWAVMTRVEDLSPEESAARVARWAEAQAEGSKA